MNFLGPTELIIIALVVLLLFGGAKLPQLMRGLGDGIKEFKKATKDEDEVTTPTSISTPTSTTPTSIHKTPTDTSV